MNLDTLRRTITVPGLRPLLLVATLARIPVTAITMTLTFQVVLGLRRGYGAAGGVVAAVTIGTAVGAPLLGRLVDRRGLRTALAITLAAQGCIWALVPELPYPVLIGVALVGGLLAVPVHSIVRQSIAAMVPEGQRRQAYSLDSISVEIAFMAGPPLAVLLSAAVSARLAVYTTGASLVLAGIALLVVNPPVRAAHEATADRRQLSVRQWMSPRLAGALIATIAAMVVLGGTDVAIVATMRQSGHVRQAGAVLMLWCGYSIIGGLLSGAAARMLPMPVLLGLLGLATAPVGLGGGAWWQLALALIPAGLLCAPTLSATADLVSRLAPAQVRGAATGLLGSCSAAGLAIGATVSGAVTDSTGPAWSFLAVGVCGLVVALPWLILVAPAGVPNRRVPANRTGASLAAATAGAAAIVDGAAND